ncbi:hypothetical protein ACHAW6_002179 [Cyclotella cf. meneghiniana]
MRHNHIFGCQVYVLGNVLAAGVLNIGTSLVPLQFHCHNDFFETISIKNNDVIKLAPSCMP